jgi:hypothetical protein
MSHRVLSKDRGTSLGRICGEATGRTPPQPKKSCNTTRGVCITPASAPGFPPAIAVPTRIQAILPPRCANRIDCCSLSGFATSNVKTDVLNIILVSHGVLSFLSFRSSPVLIPIVEGAVAARFRGFAIPELRAFGPKALAVFMPMAAVRLICCLKRMPARDHGVVTWSSLPTSPVVTALPGEKRVHHDKNIAPARPQGIEERQDGVTRRVLAFKAA